MTCTSSQGQPLYPQESHQNAIIPLGLPCCCCCSYRVVPIGRTDGWIGGHDMWRHFVYFNAAYKLDPFIKINQNALRREGGGFQLCAGPVYLGNWKQIWVEFIGEQRKFNKGWTSRASGRMEGGRNNWDKILFHSFCSVGPLVFVLGRPSLQGIG